MLSQHMHVPFFLCPSDTAICVQLLTSEVPCSALTWQWLTNLAALSREALRTVAAIAIALLQAAPSVETGVGLAWVILHCKGRQTEWESGGRLTDKCGFIIYFTEKEHYGSALNVDKLQWAVSQHYASLIILTEPVLLCSLMETEEEQSGQTERGLVDLSLRLSTRWRIGCSSSSVVPLFIMTDTRQAKDNVLSRPPPAVLLPLIPGTTDEPRSS